MLDIETCVDKLNTIKSTIGSGDDLFDSIISYLQDINPSLSDDCECRHRDNCMFYSTYKDDIRRVNKSVKGKNLAFGDSDTEYYKLLIDIGRVKAGTIFYYDPYDDVRGSIAAGCLKLAWTSRGDCQAGLCGDTIVFHASMKEDTSLFKRVE